MLQETVANVLDPIARSRHLTCYWSSRGSQVRLGQHGSGCGVRARAAVTTLGSNAAQGGASAHPLLLQLPHPLAATPHGKP